MTAGATSSPGARRLDTGDSRLTSSRLASLLPIVRAWQALRTQVCSADAIVFPSLLGRGRAWQEPNCAFCDLVCLRFRGFPGAEEEG